MMIVEHVILNTFVSLIYLAVNLNMRQHKPMRKCQLFAHIPFDINLKMSVDFEVDLQKETIFETCYYRRCFQYCNQV